MSDTYQIIVNGLDSGIAKESAVAKLTQLLDVSDEKIIELLASPNFIIKKGLDSALAETYKKALQDCGCICTIKPEHFAYEIEHVQPIEDKVIPAAQKIADQTLPIVDKTLKASKTTTTDALNSRATVAGGNRVKAYIAEFSSFSRRKKIIHVGIAGLLCLVVLTGISGKPHHRQSSEFGSNSSSSESDKDQAQNALDNLATLIHENEDSSDQRCSTIAKGYIEQWGRWGKMFNDAEQNTRRYQGYETTANNEYRVISGAINRSSIPVIESVCRK